MNFNFEEERTLSKSEEVIMKAVWDYDRETGQEISVPQLIERLHAYGKDYARTTVVTFLLKLSDKGYVRTHRKGKISYVYILKSEDDYKDLLLDNMIEFWYKGNAAELKERLEKKL